MVGKVINDERDDLEVEELEADSSSSNLIIETTDFDYLPIPQDDDPASTEEVKVSA